MSDERFKFVCGHAIGAVVVLGLLGVISRIALGTVQEATSYGLMPLVVGLSNLAILYGNWAWQQPKEPPK